MAPIPTENHQFEGSRVPGDRFSFDLRFFRSYIIQLMKVSRPICFPFLLLLCPLLGQAIEVSHLFTDYVDNQDTPIRTDGPLVSDRETIRNHFPSKNTALNTAYNQSRTLYAEGGLPTIVHKVSPDGTKTKFAEVKPADEKNTSPQDQFGQRVAWMGDLLIISAPLDGSPLGPRIGSVFGFREIGGSFSEVFEKITVPRMSEIDHTQYLTPLATFDTFFGKQIATYNQTLFASSGSSVFAYNVAGSSYSLVKKLIYVII